MSDAENPYAAALADLRAKRDKINNTIAVLEEMSGLKLVPAQSGTVEFAPSTPSGGIEETAGMYLGMSIVDASKKLLAMRKRTLGNVEIARELQAGGLAMNSKDPVNTVGSVLTRRFGEVGDVVKVGRGIWGLKEWYPGRSFKPSDKRLSREAIEANLNALDRTDAAETAARIVADQDHADQGGLNDVLG